MGQVVHRMQAAYESGQITNGALVAELERRVAERLGVDHVIAVSSCTTGLMLTVQAIDPTPGVVVPSFTFMATAHAVAWNGLAPVFAECDESSLLLDADDAGRRASGAAAILATHLFGAPCDTVALDAVAAAHRIPIVYDSAHALGSTHGGRPIGSFGLAEVFSLSPTKLVVAGEGGLVTTNDEALATTLRHARDYGNEGDYDAQVVGLNGRMSELHAAMAIESLALLDEHVRRRRALAARYVEGVRSIPGLRPQRVHPDDESSFKDLCLVVDPDTFGLDRDEIMGALRRDGIDCRSYFSPPVHRQHAYRDVPPVDLPVTDRVAARTLCLPIFGDLGLADVDRVVEALARIQQHADEIRHSALL
jgi:dTDP-4-amino-4,6-dideoxygalactose transaminase